MPPRRRRRGRNGGRMSYGVSKAATTKSNKKPSSKGGTKKGRAKAIPDPPRVLELKARKAELGISFKIIGSYEKAALFNLAEKSLDALKEDVKYHESLQEFQKLTHDLNERHNCLTLKLEARRRYEEELARRSLEQNIHLINEQYKNKLKDLKEESIAKVQESILYVENMSRVGGRIEEIPFHRGEDDRKVTKLAAPPQIVHPVAIPFFKDQLADGKSSIKTGDNLLHQHPANFWLSRTDAQKKAINMKQSSIIEANLKSAQDEKIGIYKKRTATANSLFNPPSGVSGMEIDVDEDDLQLDDQSALPDTAALGDQNQFTDLSDDAAEMSLDVYGVRIPRKKIRGTSRARPNNYMVVPRAFDFEDAEGQILEDGSIGIQEIGFRTWTTRNIRNRDYFIGSGTSPNPEFFFIPQRVGDVNSGNNSIEDMRAVSHIAHTHKLHPTLGIVLPQSVNPDYADLEEPYFPPPTDKTYPLEPLKPHIIIQDNSDGTKTVSCVQRSWLRQTQENFENIGARSRISALLKATGDYVEPEQYPPDFYHETGAIDKELVGAVMAVLGEKGDNTAPPKSVPASKLATPRSTHTSVPSITQSRNNLRQFRPQYDPVRDSFPRLNSHDFPPTLSAAPTYQTPYFRSSQQLTQSPTKTTQTPLHRSILDHLAENALGTAKVSPIPASAQKIPPFPLSAPAVIPVVHTLPVSYPQAIQQPKQPIKSRMPFMNLPLQYHGEPSPISMPTQLISPQPPQHLIQQYPSNQSMMLASSYPIMYDPNLSLQAAFIPQPPLPSNFTTHPHPHPHPHQLPPSSHKTHLPPPANYAPRLQSQTTYAGQLSELQLSPTRYNPGSNTFRELRPAVSQNRPQPPPAVSPIPPPQMYTWNNNLNFHSNSHR